MFKFIDNQSKNGTECEQIFGSHTNVGIMAKVWEKNAKLFHLAMMAGIDEYTSKGVFSSDEWIAFKKGLSVIPDQMQKCLDEIVGQAKEESSEDSNS